MPAIAKIVPHLWYAQEAEEAARFYTAIFPDSRIERVTDVPTETPSGPPGSVQIVEFTLCGQPFLALSAGPLDPFNHAISFCMMCDDQAEIDAYWTALLDGGTAEQCGWLKDRYGVSWQIVPQALGDMMADPDRARAQRVAARHAEDGEARPGGAAGGLQAGGVIGGDLKKGEDDEQCTHPRSQGVRLCTTLPLWAN